MNDRTRVFNVDCLPAMKEFPDKYFDLAIVDPPYGLGDFTTNDETIADKRGNPVRSSRSKYKKVTWNSSIPEEAYFLHLQRISKNHIVFGFQYYIEHLWPALRGIIIHDFKNNTFNLSHADCAITNLQNRTTVFRYLWSGFQKEFNEPTDSNRIHPCEKPVSLYKWLLKNYAKEGDKILDTHLGSQSSRIAAFDMGFDFTGYETDKDYFDSGNKRFAQHKAQLKLFV